MILTLGFLITNLERKLENKEECFIVKSVPPPRSCPNARTLRIYSFVRQRGIKGAYQLILKQGADPGFSGGSMKSQGPLKVGGGGQKSGSEGCSGRT